MKQKYLINCEHGANDPEKATIAFILAFTSSKTNPTAVFITSDAALLMIRQNRPQVIADGYEPLNVLIDGYIANGGQIWICPACARARGIAEADLIDGAILAGAPKTMAYLADGAMTLA
jgi:predicted peroxiredoxin